MKTFTVKTRVDRPTTKSRRDVIPPLENGDHLSRAEFERRYSAYPDMKKAELIEGVVYVPSPVSLEHAEPHSRIITLLGTYLGVTPGTHLADNVTIRLDLDNEAQPDASLWLDEEVGGKARATEEGYLSGSPELIVEVAASSAAYDLHEKQRVYRRNSAAS
jgi:Uma2 family endonuclease